MNTIIFNGKSMMVDSDQVSFKIKDGDVINTTPEAKLVSFGNYLLERYGVKEYSTDGLNTPLFQRMVNDADLKNWGFVEENILPSRFQINDKVSIKFGALTVKEAKVIKVHFTENKVLYDLEVNLGEFLKYQNRKGVFIGQGTTTRLYNVDSLIVEDI